MLTDRIAHTTYTVKDEHPHNQTDMPTESVRTRIIEEEIIEDLLIIMPHPCEHDIGSSIEKHKDKMPEMDW